MRFEKVCLEAFGYALPEEVVTSAELERRLKPIYERFGLREGRLELMTGIRERRFWRRSALPSDGAARAGMAALRASGTDPDEIECLLSTSVSRDCLEPATASIIHDKMNLPSSVTMFDISNACLGFVNGMLVLGSMIELGQIKKGLVVAGESSRRLVESTLDDLLNTPDLTKKQFKTAFASLTIGSGAVALVMAHESASKTGHELLGGAVRAASEHHRLCRGSADVGFTPDADMMMNTDSETLMVHGCELAARTWPLLKEELGWRNQDVDRCFTHQVGVAQRDLMYEKLGLDPNLDYATLDRLGNVGSASLPITMALGVEEKPPREGEKIAMLGIGSGLNCVMLGVRW